MSLRAYAYESLAWVGYSQGDNAHAAAASRQAALLARELDDGSLLATALAFDAASFLVMGNRADPTSRALLEEAIAAGRARGILCARDGSVDLGFHTCDARRRPRTAGANS